MGYREGRDVEAPFNMAIATLMRLDKILIEIKNLDYLYTFDSADKQKSYISLVKQFYINSIPLLGETESEKYKDEILNIGLSTKTKIKSGSQMKYNVYDQKVDKRLNEILIEIQQKLSKYFMPRGKDPSRAVTNF